MLPECEESNGAIAVVLGCGRSTVAFVSKTVRTGPSPPKNDNRGRPVLLVYREVRQLKRDLDGMRLSCVAASPGNVNRLRAMATTTSKFTVGSPWTVRQALRRLGSTSSTPFKKYHL